MEERTLSESSESMGKVANLVAVAMGVARLLRMPEVRKEYLGGDDLPLLLMGVALEEAAHEAEGVVDWSAIVPTESS